MIVEDICFYFGYHDQFAKRLKGKNEKLDAAMQEKKFRKLTISAIDCF